MEKIRGTDTVVFYTPAVNQTGPASVAVLENLDTRDFFLYKENPVFTGINPTVQIQSGGNNLTITGTNLDSTPEPKIILKERVRGVVTRSFVSEECIVLDFTSMICKAPNTLAGNDARRKRDLDDEDFEDDYISHVFEPVASDNSRGAEFEGTVFKDPEFERFPERPDIKTYYVGRDTHLNIKILNNIADKIRGQLEQILAVTIGEDLCPGVALTDNQVLCDLRNISHADDERDVVIQAGGTPYYLNAIIYKNPSGFERFLYLTPGPTGAYPTLVFAPVGIAALLAALFCLCKLVLTKCSLAIRRHVKRRRQRELQRAADTGNYIHPSIDNNNSQDVPIEGTVSVDNRNDHSKTLTEEKAAVPRYYGPRPGTPRRNVTPSALRRVHPSAEEDPGQGERPHGYVEVLPPNQDADKRGKYSGYCTHLPTANDAVQVPTSQQIIQEEEARWRRAQDEGYVPMRTPDVPADLFQPRFEKRKQTTTHDLFGSGAALSDRDGAVTPISVHSKLVFDFDDAVSQTETPPSVDLLCGGGEDEDGYLQPVQSEQPPDGEETNPRDRLNPQCANWVLQGNNYD